MTNDELSSQFQKAVKNALQVCGDIRSKKTTVQHILESEQQEIFDVDVSTEENKWIVFSNDQSMLSDCIETTL